MCGEPVVVVEEDPQGDDKVQEFLPGAALDHPRHALEHVVSLTACRDRGQSKRHDRMAEDAVEVFPVADQHDFEAPEEALDPGPADGAVAVFGGMREVVVYAPAGDEESEEAVVPRLLFAEEVLEQLEDLLVRVAALELL